MKVCTFDLLLRAIMIVMMDMCYIRYRTVVLRVSVIETIYSYALHQYMMMIAGERIFRIVADQ